MSEWTTVPGTESLTDGSCVVVDIDDAKIAVYRIEGQFYAIEDVCTHDGGELASGKVEGNEVICPRHGARFCIRTGAVLCPPAYEPVHCFPLRNEAGTIQIRDDRWD